ncbi:MAG TPA: RsiV family protein [Chitinophagales bacterium]|nr:RsiV family protein [Chitinophagales bacterium]
MKKKNLIIVIGLLFIFTACKNNGQNTNAQSKDAIYTDTLAYEMKSIKRDTVVKGASEYDTTSIELIYPLFDIHSAFGKQLNDSMIKRVSLIGEENESGYSTIQSIVDDFMQQYKSYVEESPMDFPWYNQTEINILNNNSNIISFRMALESYTGGAHGSHYVIFDNYNRKTNTLIKIEDVLKDKHDKALLEIGEFYFKQIREIPQKESLQENGAFEAGWLDENQKAGFYFNDNFTIDKDNLTFYYNEYEVSSYAFGPTELKIPLEKIRPYLKNSFGF